PRLRLVGRHRAAPAVSRCRDRGVRLRAWAAGARRRRTARHGGIDLLLSPDSVSAWLDQRHRLAPAAGPAAVRHRLAGRLADQQPLAIREPYQSRIEDYLLLVGPKAKLPDAEWLRENYDFVWVFNPEKKRLRMPATFQLVYQSEELNVWRVR